MSSRFALVWHRDGKPAAARELGAVVGAAEGLAPDGVEWFVDGNLAIVHFRYHDTPQELHEPRPLTTPEHQLVIALDGRIDDRNELCRKLGITAPADTVGDIELVKQAWLRWRTNMPRYLYGDYSIAIIDRAKRSLYACTDAMAGRRLFYANHGSSVVLASQAHWVAAHPQISSELDLPSFMAYCMGDYRCDRSLYCAVSAVPQEHALHCDDTQLQIRRWWHVSSYEQDCHQADQVWQEEFNALMVAATDDRMRCQSRLGLSMSAGIDSATLLASVPENRREDVMPFHLELFRDSNIAEREGARQSARSQQMDITVLHGDAELLRSLNEPDAAATSAEGPWQTVYPGDRFFSSVCQDQAITVMLAGLMGDQLLLGSTRIFLKRLLGGDWRCYQDAKRFAALLRRPENQVWRRYFWSFLVPGGVRGVLGINKPSARTPWFKDAAITLIQPDADKPTEPREDHQKALTHGLEALVLANPPSIREDAQRLQLRLPYMDRRLREWALTAPESIWARHGESKHLARQFLRSRHHDPMIAEAPKTTPMQIPSSTGRTRLAKMLSSPSAAEQRAISVMSEWVDWKELIRRLDHSTSALESDSVASNIVTNLHWLTRHIQ